MSNNNCNKVLILSCGTGGGHNTAAKAVQEELRSKEVEADFKEYLEIINPTLKDKINNLYIKSTNKNGKMFKKIYTLGRLYEKTKLKSPVYFLNSLNKEKLYKYIVNNNYGFIITTHLFASQALTAIKKKYNIHFMQIATDYVSIPFWEETNPDYFIIPSKELEADFMQKMSLQNNNDMASKPKIRLHNARKKEENSSKIKVLPLGIPVMKQFREEYNKAEIKKELQLDNNKKYILILNGSMGFGNVKEIAKRLLENTKNVTFIISCGNNTELYNFLTNEYKNNDRIIALSYTNELGKYMACSEIILTKPGGLTTTEVSVMRKPLIHIMPIPGCENYNANFFSERKMSIKCENIEEIIKYTKKLIKSKNLKNRLIENQKKYIAKDTCEKIADIVIKELNRGNI